MITLQLINASSAASHTLNNATFNSTGEFIEYCELFGNSIRIISNEEYARGCGYSDWAALLVAEEPCDEDFIEAYMQYNGLVVEMKMGAETTYKTPETTYKTSVTNHIYNNQALPEKEIVQFHLDCLSEMHGGYAKLV